MPTQIAFSPDGTSIAYDICGSGPALMLLHSGAARARTGPNAMLSYHHVAAALAGSPVQVHLLDGMTHAQELDEIERVLPVVLTFMRSYTRILILHESHP